jgi:hypothetical protein
MRKRHWTLIMLVALGGSAEADPKNDDESGRAGVLAIEGGSRRGVSQDYLVLPSGGEITGAMRFVTTVDPVFGDSKLHFSDLALFTVGGRYALLSKLELSAQGSFLAKQPSDTDERPWQSAGVGLRSPLGRRVALAINGGTGHLMDHAGRWTSESLTIQWRKPINEFVQFDMSAGLGGVGLRAPKSPSGFLTEVATTGSVQFRADKVWGGWIGLGYALPVAVRGHDPTTGLTLDPQPRLDFHVGTVLSLNKWDLFAEFAVVDRGDMADAATRLPVLDGGFDQRQVLFGVTRHIDGKRRRRDYDDDDAMQLSQR